MKKLFLVLFLMPLATMGSPQGVPALTVATVGTSSTLALPANQYRGYLIMQNQGGASCIMRPGAAVVTPDGIKIDAGQNYEMQQAYTKSAIYMQCASAGNRIVFLETNF